MKVLAACECSGRVREAFRRAGHDAYSCDLQPAEDGSPNHFQCDVKELLSSTNYPRYFDMIIAHPVCTVMAVSGVSWCSRTPKKLRPGVLYGEARRAAIDEAVAFAKFFSGKAPKVAIENPVGLLSSRWRKPDQTVQPWWFGVPAFKGICLWLEGLPLLQPTNKLVPPAKGTQEHKAWSVIHRCPPGPDRAVIRSRTFPGLATAFAQQWG